VRMSSEKDRVNLIKFFYWGICGVAMFYVNSVYAATSGDNIASIANNVKDTFSAIAQLITAASYIAGMGFGVGAIMKFKAHKDNPTQIPVGTPIALLFIAAALLFMPTIFKVAGGTLFGSSGTVGGISGTTEF
jgi:intracellular multiplication protein IcmD